MALRQVYESDLLSYRTFGDVPAGPFAWMDYGDNIPVPWMEAAFSAWPLQGIWLRADDAMPSGMAVRVMTRESTRYFPSWNFCVHSFDAETGSADPEPAVRYNLGGGTFEIENDTGISWIGGYGAQGPLWRYLFTGSPATVNESFWITVILKQKFSNIAHTVESILPNWIVAPFFIDPAKDIVVSKGRNFLNIHQLSSGGLLGTLDIHTEIVDLFREDATRAYAVTADGNFLLFDYISKQWLGVFSSGLDTTVSHHIRCTWDTYHKRIYAIQYVPDAQDGSCAMRVRGYVPDPSPDYVTIPIPLQTPREGRVVHVYTRTIDFSGAGIVGRKVSLEAAGANGVVLGTPIGTDRYGGALFNVRCDADGLETLTATTEVPD